MLKKNEIIKIITSFFKKKDIIPNDDDKKFIRYYHIFFRWLKNNHIEAYMKYRKNLLLLNKSFYDNKDFITSNEIDLDVIKNFMCSMKHSFVWAETKEGSLYWQNIAIEWECYVLKNRKILHKNKKLC